MAYTVSRLDRETLTGLLKHFTDTRDWYREFIETEPRHRFLAAESEAQRGMIDAAARMSELEEEGSTDA